MPHSCIFLYLAVGLVEASEDEAEVTSRVLWLHGAVQGEAAALHEQSAATRVDNRNLRLKISACRDEQNSEKIQLMQMIIHVQAFTSLPEIFQLLCYWCTGNS